jgi:hypothetical protein
MVAIGSSFDLGPTSFHTAAERLARTLHERTAEYRTDATIDLTMVDALLKTEGPAAASEALDDHACSLDALVADLHLALAEATVERDAEAILETARSGVEPPSGLVQRLRATVLGVAGAITLLATVVIVPFRILGAEAFTPRRARRPASLK